MNVFIFILFDHTRCWAMPLPSHKLSSLIHPWNVNACFFFSYCAILLLLFDIHSILSRLSTIPLSSLILFSARSNNDAFMEVALRPGNDKHKNKKAKRMVNVCFFPADFSKWPIKLNNVNWRISSKYVVDMFLVLTKTSASRKGVLQCFSFGNRKINYILLFYDWKRIEHLWLEFGID